MNGFGDAMAPTDPDLQAALDRFQIELTPPTVELLERYCQAIWTWNERLNLTRHTTYEKFVTRDLVDSRAIASALDAGETILDIGTGAGVPGLILAALRPDLNVSVCDSVGKKVRAVEAVVAQLGLPVAVHHDRVERLLGQNAFDTLVARAVAPLPKLLTWLAPHWHKFTRLLVIKNRNCQQECDQARQLGLLDAAQLRTIAEYDTPGTGASNVVLQIRGKRGQDSFAGTARRVLRTKEY